MSLEFFMLSRLLLTPGAIFSFFIIIFLNVLLCYSNKPTYYTLNVFQVILKEDQDSHVIKGLEPGTEYEVSLLAVLDDGSESEVVTAVGTTRKSWSGQDGHHQFPPADTLSLHQVPYPSALSWATEASISCPSPSSPLNSFCIFTFNETNM